VPRVIPERLQNVGALLLRHDALVDRLQVSPHLVDIPELLERPGAGILGSQSEGQQLGNPRVEVKAELLVDLPPHIAAPWHECTHAPSEAASGPADITRATAAT
jgi:hypothetical protein